MQTKSLRPVLMRIGHLLIGLALALLVTGSAYAQAASVPPEGEHWGSEGVAHPNSCAAYGWAVDADDFTRETLVRVLADGTEVVRGQTAQAWFYFNLWGLIPNYTEHQIAAQAYDVETGQWADLAFTPKSLTCVNYDLYLLNVKTGTVERLTTLADTGEYNASWAPDGRQVVHDVTDAYFHGLFITDVQTHISTPLPGGDGGNDAAWSPNGQWIVFDRRWSNNDLNLYVLPPAGGVPQLVVSNATNGAWSPNSQRLVFERDGGVWTARAGGGDERPVVAAGNNPAWSPNGQWIAYDLDGDIWKVRVNQAGGRVGDPIQLTSGSPVDGGVTWSQNSHFIAYASDVGGETDLWQVPAAGGDPVRLAGAGGLGDYDPGFSNNGQYIAYDGARLP